MSQLAGITAENCTLWQSRRLAYFLFENVVSLPAGVFSGLRWTRTQCCPTYFLSRVSREYRKLSRVESARRTSIYLLFHFCFFRQKGVLHNLQSAESLVIQGGFFVRYALEMTRPLGNSDTDDVFIVSHCSSRSCKLLTLLLLSEQVYKHDCLQWMVSPVSKPNPKKCPGNHWWWVL